MRDIDECEATKYGILTMTNSYFKQVPNFEYVNRNTGNQDISNYVTVKNLFKRGKIRPDIFQT